MADDSNYDEVGSMIDDVFEELGYDKDFVMKVDDDDDEILVELDEDGVVELDADDQIEEHWDDIIESIKDSDEELGDFCEQAIYLGIDSPTHSVVFGFSPNQKHIKDVIDDEEKAEIIINAIDNYCEKGYGIQFIQLMDEEDFF